MEFQISNGVISALALASCFIGSIRCNLRINCSLDHCC